MNVYGGELKIRVNFSWGEEEVETEDRMRE